MSLMTNKAGHPFLFIGHGCFCDLAIQKFAHSLTSVLHFLLFVRVLYILKIHSVQDFSNGKHHLWIFFIVFFWVMLEKL